MANSSSISTSRNTLSILLFVVAGVLLAIAIYLFWQDRKQDSTPAPPTALPGHAQMKTVSDALEDEDLDVDYGPGSVRVDELSPVGQQLIIGDASAYVFIFDDPETREREMAGLSPEDIELVDAFGDPVTTEPVSIAEGSNVAVMVVGGDEELTASVADALATIP